MLWILTVNYLLFWNFPHAYLCCLNLHFPWVNCYFGLHMFYVEGIWGSHWITAMVLYESCPVVRVQEACSPPRAKAETSKVSLPISSSLQFAIYSSSQAPSSQAPSSPALESHSAQPFTSVLDSSPVTLPLSGASMPTGPKGAQG